LFAFPSAKIIEKRPVFNHKNMVWPRKKLIDKKKKGKEKSDGVAHWRTEACKLFRSRFQMLCNTFMMRSPAK